MPFDYPEPHAIRIGTLVNAIREPVRYIEQILPHGFESFALTFGGGHGDLDLPDLAATLREKLDPLGIPISAIGVYGNPLRDDAAAQACRETWRALIDHAPAFGADIVSGFAGRLTDRPIPDSIDRFREVFAPLADQAGEKGIRIAFENCSMGGDWNHGDWNIAHNPAAWELMFQALPQANLGLEWEPCHQMVQLIEPLPQLREWAPRIFHLHGKDATIHHDIIRRHGIFGAEPFAFHRTPGFGDSNWTDILSELRRAGYRGSIDIEGWHDPVYRDALEMTGQVHALHHLKACRGGNFTANP